MSTLYHVKFNSGQEMPLEERRDSRRFDFHFSYDLLDSKREAKGNLLVRVVVPGLHAIGLSQDIEKILYWLAVQKLSIFIEKEATGLQLLELISIPSYPDPSTIEYPPKDEFIVAVSRQIGFRP